MHIILMQDGVLEVVGEIVGRMSDFRTMAADVSKNTADIENYSKEFLSSRINCTNSNEKSLAELNYFGRKNGTRCRA